MVEHKNSRGWFSVHKSEIVFIICEAIVILFFGLFTEFTLGNPNIPPEKEAEALEEVYEKYAMF